MEAAETMRSEGALRTHTLLAKALIALTVEQCYDTIGIRDITERAGVGSATFFDHYTDKDALLADVLRVVLDELPAELTRSAYMPDAAGASRVFQYAQQHSEIVRVLVHSSAVRPGLLDVCLGIALTKQDLTGGDVLLPEKAAYYTIPVALALIDWWLTQGMPYSPERMGEITYELLIRPRWAAARTAAPATTSS